MPESSDKWAIHSTLILVEGVMDAKFYRYIAMGLLREYLRGEQSDLLPVFIDWRTKPREKIMRVYGLDGKEADKLLEGLAKVREYYLERRVGVERGELNYMVLAVDREKRRIMVVFTSSERGKERLVRKLGSLLGLGWKGGLRGGLQHPTSIVAIVDADVRGDGEDFRKKIERHKVDILEKMRRVMRETRKIDVEVTLEEVCEKAYMIHVDGVETGAMLAFQGLPASEKGKPFTDTPASLEDYIVLLFREVFLGRRDRGLEGKRRFEECLRGLDECAKAYERLCREAVGYEGSDVSARRVVALLRLAVGVKFDQDLLDILFPQYEESYGTYENYVRYLSDHCLEAVRVLKEKDGCLYTVLRRAILPS